jgi:RHS repeat-associated protein
MEMPRLTALAVGVLISSTQAYAVMYKARPYEPNMARWLTRDPIGEPGGSVLNGFSGPGADPSEGTRSSEEISGPNLYCFVGNNPLNAIDPLGLRVLGLQEVVQKSHDNLPAGIRRDITPCVMVALLWKESGFDTTTTNPRSSARGIAQILNRPADDIQDRIAKGFGGSDPFYTLAKGERFRNHRFNPDVSIFAAYIYLDDRYRATGSLSGALNAYGPGGALVLIGAECLCSKCGGFSYNPTTGAITISNGRAAWDCLHAIHQD